MPIYAYRCACGKTADVLVRGREPASCDDVAEFGGLCASPGALTRQLSAPYVSKTGSTSTPSRQQPGDCGHCGMTPGSCGDN